MPLHLHPAPAIDRRGRPAVVALAAALAALALLGPAPVSAAYVPSGSVSPHVWSPGLATPAYENGNPDGYFEADTAAMALHLTNLAGQTYDVDMCLEVLKGGKYAFSAFDTGGWDDSYLPDYLPDANGSDCGADCDIDYQDGTWDLDASGIWGRNVTINSIDGPAKGQAGCDEAYVGVTANFTVDAGANRAWITYGGLFAVAGAPLPAGFPDSSVPVGSGASSVSGVFQSRIEGAGNKTINFSASAIQPAPADIGVTTLCADFFAPEPYIYASTVTNHGPNVATAVELVDTLPLGVTYDDTATDLRNPDADCDLLDADPDIVGCAYAGDQGFGTGNLGAGDSWVVEVVVDLDSGASGSLSHTVAASATEDDDNATNDEDSCASTVAVSLNRFASVHIGDRVRASWTTATEAGTAAFALHALTDGTWAAWGAPVAAQGIDSIEPHDYALEGPGAGVEALRLLEMDVRGRTTTFGPFAVGAEDGVLHSDPSADTNVASDGSATGAWSAAPTPDKVSVRRAGAAATVARKSPAARLCSVDRALDLLVTDDGVHRVTFARLRDAGLDLTGVPASSVAVTRGGLPVAVRVEPPASHTGDGFVELYATARDSLYSDAAVYRLAIDPAAARRVAIDGTGPSHLPPVPSHQATHRVERQREYTYAPPADDPWYDTAMLTFTAPRSWDFWFDAGGLLPGAGPAQLTVELWGVTDWPAAPDHRVRVELNGRWLSTETFDGHVGRSVALPLPPDLLLEAGNRLRLTLPGDTGVAFDLVNLDAYGVTYPRRFEAVGGGLEFTAAGPVFEVTGLPAPGVVVYRLESGVPTLLSNVAVGFDGRAYTARFAGRDTPATYVVRSVEHLPVPALEPVRPYAEIRAGAAHLLVLAHPSLLAGIQPLLDARRAQGLGVQAVDVFDVYAQFGDGVPDPEAIRAYVRYAAAQKGTQFVLIVGRDTYDYKNYLGLGGTSFVPTLYGPVDDLITFAPLDSLYVDIDVDGIPDLAIGRLPVGSAAELDALVSKIVAYEAKTYAATAVFAADGHDGRVSFAADSDMMLGLLPEQWVSQRAYIGALGGPGARSVLLERMAAGMAVTNYVGHSSPRGWARDTLLKAGDVPTLGNVGRPTFVVQWGCWNAYHVAPAADTLAHALLRAPDRGAAAVLGAVALSSSQSESALARHLMPLLSRPGTPVGQSVLAAKQALGAARPEARDVLLGWTLLGDPTMRVDP